MILIITGFWMVQHQLYATMPKYVLRLAGEGQKILFVNGVTEENLPLGGCTFHKKAASRTPYVMESDEKTEGDCLRDQGISGRDGDGWPDRRRRLPGKKWE